MTNEYDGMLLREEEDAGGNEYDQLIAGADQAKRVTVRENLMGAIDARPDTVAKARQVAAKTGIPEDVAERNLPQIENKLKINEYDELLAKSPKLRDQMTDRRFARVALDDLPGLSAVEGLLRTDERSQQAAASKVLRADGFAAASRLRRQQQDANAEARVRNAQNPDDLFTADGQRFKRGDHFRNSWEQGLNTVWTTLHGMRAASYAELAKAGDETAQRGFDDSMKRIRSISEQNQVLGSMGRESTQRFFAAVGDDKDVFDKLSEIGGALADDPVGIGADLLAQSGPASLAVVASALLARVGGVNPALAGGGASTYIEVGNQYAQRRMAGQDHESAWHEALVKGAVIGAFDAASIASAGRAVDQVVRTTAMRRAGTAVRETGRQAVLGGGGEAVSSFAIGENPEPADIVAEAIGEVFAAPLEGVAAASRSSYEIVAERLTGRQQRAEAADAAMQRLVQLNEAAQQSKLRARDPDSFQQFIDSASQDGPLQDVYIDANTFAQMIEDAGGLDELAQSMPEVAKQMDEALAVGGDIRIPVGEYVTRLADSPLNEQLLPHLRTSPDAMSQIEAQEFYQTQVEQFEQEARQVMTERAEDSAWQESAAKVQTDIFTQLQQTGRFTDDVNTAYANLMRDFYTVNAQKLGITPEEMAARYPIQIRAMGKDTDRTLQAMKQLGPLLTDSEGNAIAYTKPVQEAFTKWFEGSKVVDEQNRPLVVYHGTNAEFDTFDGAQDGSAQGFNAQVPGVWFARDKGIAQRFGPNVKQAYLTLRNPARIPAAEYMQRFMYDEEDPAVFRAELEQAGFDGLIIEADPEYADGAGPLGTEEWGQDNYIAFDPTQIKSATENIGTYDPDNPNIYYQTDPAIEQRFEEKLQDHEAAVTEYATRPDSRGGKVLNTDIARELSEDYLADRTKSADVHEPASAFIKRLYAEKLAQEPGPNEAPLVFFTAGGTGAGKTTAISAVPEVQAVSDIAQIIYDTNMSTYASAKAKIDQALEAGKIVRIAYVMRDPVDALVAGALPRAMRQEREFGTGRTVPLREHAATHRGAADTVVRLAEEYANDERVQLFAIDNSNGRGKAELVTVSNGKAFDYNDVEHRLLEALKGEYEKGTISQQVFEGFAGAQAETTGVGQTVRPEDRDSNAQGIEQGQTELAQNPDDVARGKITLAKGINQASVITLLKDANLSTFLHETGHFFLEVTADIASRPDAPPQIAADFQAILDWFGIKADEKGVPIWAASDDFDLNAHPLDAEILNLRRIRERDARLGTELDVKGMASPALVNSGRISEVFDAPPQGSRTAIEVWNALGFEEKRPYHEQFARGFEAYLFEGKAPSLEMRGAFQRFRAWLVSIYKSLTALRVDLSDEVRGVMDRMLASEADIKDAETARGFLPLFKSAEQAGMTTEEWAAYQSLGQEASDDAVNELQRRSLRDMQYLTNARARVLKQLQRDAAAKRKVIEGEVRAEIQAEPVYAAMRFLKRGEVQNGDEQIEISEGHKLSIPALKDLYPAGELNSLDFSQLGYGQYGMLAEDGLHPDLVAEMFGFTSGDELVRAMLDAQPIGAVVEAVTDQRMLERYGDLSTDKGIERAANEAVHNEARSRFLATELRQLEKAIGTRKTLVAAAKDYAERMIAGKRVRDIKPSQYIAAESRAGKAAEKARIAGELKEAAAAKRAQLLQNYAAKAALNAIDEIEKAVAYLKKFGREGTRKALDPEYTDQIDALLERFDLRSGQSLTAIDKRTSLLQWVERQRELGFEPDIDERLLNEASRKHFRDMTVEEVRGLVDTVRNIEHLGRLKKKLLTAADKREFEAVVDEAATSIENNASKTVAERIENNTFLDRVRQGGNEFLAMHRKFASLVRQMDGHQDNGVLWNIFVRSMNGRANQEAVQREQATIKLSALFKPILQTGNLRQKQFIPEIGRSLSREGRLAIALNWGNETNRLRVLEGERWTPSQADAVLKSLTKEEWDFVQSVWDYIDSYWPDIAAKEKRVTGNEPEKVQASSFETPHGIYKGGYYPIKYDPTRSTKADADNLAEIVKQSMQGLYTRATTRRGHTKARTDSVKRPVRKDFGVLFEHVNQVIHDVAWHEWLIDANRLLGASAIDNAIRTHYGPETLKVMRDAITDIAAGDVPAANVFERSINHLRAGVSIAGMGWNIFTSLLQPLGLSQSLVRVGPKWVGRGIAKWMKNATTMESTVGWIYERSDFMRLRGKTMQREINEIRNRVSTNGKLAPVQDSFFYLIQKAQMVADIPTWLGAYEKAMELHNADEAQAIALADQAVLDSQGGGQIKDLAGIQRGSPLLKLWTNFYSYFNVTFNLTAESLDRTRFTNPGDVGRFAVDMLLLYTVPAVLGLAMKDAIKATVGGADWDEDEFVNRLAREQLNYMFGVMVGLRELGSAIQGFTGYSGPAGTRFFSELSNLVKQAEQGELDKAALKALNNFGGILFHYPAGAVQRAVEGWDAMADGKTANPAVLLTGYKDK